MVNGVISVPIMAVMLWLGQSQRIMGELTISTRHRLLGWTATALMALAVVVMLLTLAVSLTLLNLAPDSPYFAQSLEVWEQGRFIRFHGISQWLGWLWPFAALIFGLRAAARLPVPTPTTKIEP